MKGKAKLVRSNSDGIYKVFVRNHFWQKWKPLFLDNGKLVEFKTFKEFGEITKIESFGEITLSYNNFQGMHNTK
jgi:hypothetical protein